MKTRSLFISYRSSDASKVDKIAKDLSLLKYDDGTPLYTTWQDKHNLPPASPNWWDAIVDGIEQCDIFVFNLSRAALQSEVCRAELEYAHKRNRPIIPVVLDGEFFLNATSGKYDLPKETWILVPEWLKQVQFLFYVETQFYGKFREAVAIFDHNWPVDIPAQRPLNPDSKSVHGSNHALYSAACDYAERLAFTDAEKHFDVLVRRNDEDYANLAAQWLNLIRCYAELIDIVEHRSPVVVFKRRWTIYQGLFPNDLVEGIFDPKGLQQHFSEIQNISKSVDPVLIQTPKSTPKMGERIVDSKGVTMVYVPAGKFFMGSTDTQSDPDEQPQHEQTIRDGFWCDLTPVTNASFARFAAEKGYQNKDFWTTTGWNWIQANNITGPAGYGFASVCVNGKSKKVDFSRPQQPAIHVSWFEAYAYCAWRSGRLPTEAEWEWLVKGPDNHKFPWGNNFNSSVVVYVKNSNYETAIVGPNVRLGGASWVGILDLVGNVPEWVSSIYMPYPYKLGTGVENIEGEEPRVYRSAGYDCREEQLLPSHRYSISPDYRFGNIGFRCVKS